MYLRITNVTGCKEVKLRAIGIRIIFRIVGEKAEIVQIISVGKREDNEVFQDALKRLQEIERIAIFLDSYSFYLHAMLGFV